jgi:hypothetical protein
MRKLLGLAGAVLLGAAGIALAVPRIKSCGPEPEILPPEIESAARRIFADRRAGAVTLEPLEEEGITTAAPISEACRSAFEAFEELCP